MIPDLPTYLFAYSWAGFLSFVLVVLLPLIAALLVKQSWPGPVKGVTLLFLSAVKAVVEALIAAGGHASVGPILYATGLNFAIAVIVYVSLIRGSQIHAALLSSGNTDPPAA